MMETIKHIQVGALMFFKAKGPYIYRAGVSPMAADTFVGHSRTCASYARACARPQQADGTKCHSPGILAVS